MIRPTLHAGRQHGCHLQCAAMQKHSLIFLPGHRGYQVMPFLNLHLPSA